MDIDARNALAEQWLGLVHHVWNKHFYQQRYRRRKSEAISEGFLALVKMSRRFDKARNRPFIAPARTAIFRAMLRSVQSNFVICPKPSETTKAQAQKIRDADFSPIYAQPIFTTLTTREPPEDFREEVALLFREFRWHERWLLTEYFLRERESNVIAARMGLPVGVVRSQIKNIVRNLRRK